MRSRRAQVQLILLSIAVALLTACGNVSAVSDAARSTGESFGSGSGATAPNGQNSDRFLGRPNPPPSCAAYGRLLMPLIDGLQLVDESESKYADTTLWCIWAAGPLPERYPLHYPPLWVKLDISWGVRALSESMMQNTAAQVRSQRPDRVQHSALIESHGGFIHGVLTPTGAKDRGHVWASMPSLDVRIFYGCSDKDGYDAPTCPNTPDSINTANALAAAERVIEEVIEGQ